MKKLLLCVLVGALCIFTVAAGGQRGGARRFNIDMPLHFTAGTMEYYSVREFQRLVQEGSGGQIAVNLFPGGALGTELDNIEQMRAGFVQMTLYGDVGPAQLAAEFDTTVIPFIFPDFEAVVEFWYGPVGERIHRAFEERGNQILLGIQNRGSRHLTASRPLRTAADLAGFRLRIPPVPSWTVVWGEVGAVTTPVAWAEVFNALQTGVVEGQENPIPLIYVGSIYEVNRYIMYTAHVHAKFHWTINRDFYNSLPPEFQRLIRESVTQAIQWGEERRVAAELGFVESMRRKGVTFIEVDRQSFINAARPGIERLSAEWDPVAREATMRHLR